MSEYLRVRVRAQRAEAMLWLEGFAFLVLVNVVYAGYHHYAIDPSESR